MAVIIPDHLDVIPLGLLIERGEDKIEWIKRCYRHVLSKTKQDRPVSCHGCSYFEPNEFTPQMGYGYCCLLKKHHFAKEKHLCLKRKQN